MIPSLSEQLAEVDAEYRVKYVSYVAAIDSLVERLKANSAGETAPDVGDIFPDFVLPDAQGGLWRLADALSKGPVVISFHRGYWCDFCPINIASLAEIAPLLNEMGCQIAAISPEDAANAKLLAKEGNAEFTMLCDIGFSVAALLGLSYVVDENLRQELLVLDVDLNLGNSGEGWVLPITATFVLEQSGKIVARHLDPDPRERMDAQTILQAASAACQSAARS